MNQAFPNAHVLEMLKEQGDIGKIGCRMRITQKIDTRLWDTSFDHYFPQLSLVINSLSLLKSNLGHKSEMSPRLQHFWVFKIWPLICGTTNQVEKTCKSKLGLWECIRNGKTDEEREGRFSTDASNTHLKRWDAEFNCGEDVGVRQ